MTCHCNVECGGSHLPAAAALLCGGSATQAGAKRVAPRVKRATRTRHLHRQVIRAQGADEVMDCCHDVTLRRAGATRLSDSGREFSGGMRYDLGDFDSHLLPNRLHGRV